MSAQFKARFVIRARSPKTGRILYFTKTGTLATRGAIEKFPTMDAAWTKADKLLRQHPQIRDYGLHAEKLRDPGESGLMKKFSVRENPSGFARARDAMLADLDKAAARHEAFTGLAATKKTVYQKKPSSAAFALGELVAVTYRANRDGDSDNTVYTHEFRKNSRPLLTVDSDGTQLDIFGGKYQVTKRGIEDR